jgi:alcohol dehydrogenase (cytochrome c)
MALENCNLFFANPKPFVQGETFYDTGTKLPAGEHSQKVLLAISVPGGKIVWRYPQVGAGDSWAGTMTTGGGLIFFGDDAGSFEAADAQTGRPLWHFNTGQTIRASPMSYSVDGKQYVTIASEGDVFTFSLPR